MAVHMVSGKDGEARALRGEKFRRKERGYEKI